MNTSELLRLACIFAESDRENYLSCIAHTNDTQQIEETEAFLKAIRKYRLKRWGKTEFEVRVENCRSVDLRDLRKEMNKLDKKP